MQFNLLFQSNQSQTQAFHLSYPNPNPLIHLPPSPQASLSVCVHALVFQNQYLKLHRNRVYSMASRYRNEENTIYIEYCRSCDTHSWCTHHDESKYHETFLKFNEMITRRLPEIEVIGNMVPQNLIPFKIAENKYIDANTNKYVVFPHIGSFEVTFRGALIFSKKDTHTWPNLPSIVSKIANIFDPTYQSPLKQEPQPEEDKETSKASNNNSFLDSEEDKKTKYKTQQKGFTLTDHFKLYRPKNTFDDKDWLTQKQESEASSRQISDMVHHESREKSNKSVESKKSSDLVGQSKLKEMLKHKGMISKDQGKKEMIIRLDSIEEENAYEQAAAATQRTQEKNSNKKNRMKEIDDQINSLEDKFKKFENRVQDIQARNKEFEDKTGVPDDKSRFKQIIQNKTQLSRNLSMKKEKELDIKEKGLLADKTNKLEQYLSFSEQEKNDKLHRIYGEWKLLKQFSNKNKKLLKGKERTSQEQEMDDSASDTTSKADSRSQSPSSFANIITFKQKHEKALERKIKNLKNSKQHKYSSMERYHKGSSHLVKEIKTHTDDNFYKNPKFFRPKAEMDSDAQINAPHRHPVSRLIKKSVNTLSMNALKQMTNNQSALPKLESEGSSGENFSASAKQNINKINSRISNIQQKLKTHNNAGFSPIEESPFKDRERNYSKKSQSHSGSQHNASLKKVNKIYNPNERNSNASINTIKKNFSQEKIKSSNFSELSRPQTKKINEKQHEVIKEEEEFKPHQSKRKDAKYVESTKEDPVVRDNSPKKISTKSSNRFSNFAENTRKNSKSKEIEPKKAIRERKIVQKQGTHHEESIRRSQEHEYEGSNDKYESHPHQARQSKPLERKFKDWRESSPTNNLLKSKEVDRKTGKQGISEKIRESDSKQTVTRTKKYKVNNEGEKLKPIKPTISNLGAQEMQGKIETQAPATEQKKARSGQIKKNKIAPKQSIHKESKSPKVSTQKKDRNTRKIKASTNHQQQSFIENEERSDQEENNDEEINQTYTQNEENKQRNSRDDASSNLSNAMGIAEAKMRKTLGYFKQNDLCFRGGVKTSEQNRSGQAQSKQKNNKTSFYQAHPENEQQHDSNEEQSELQAQQEEYAENNSLRQSQESQFVPQCKKKTQNNSSQLKKEEEQGWKNKSDEFENQMLPQQLEQLENENKKRKNSLEQKLDESKKEEEEQERSDQVNENNQVHQAKTQNIVNEAAEEEFVQRPQTTQEVSNFEQEENMKPSKVQQTNQNKDPEQVPATKKKESSKKQKKTKKSKKQSKQPKLQEKKLSKQQSKRQAKIQSTIDIEQLTCKEYSEFLQLKISNDLCKVADQKLQNQYQDSEYKVNVFNCQSVSSIDQNEQQEEVPSTFANFQSSKPIAIETEIEQDEQPQAEQVAEDNYDEEFESDDLEEEEEESEQENEESQKASDEVNEQDPKSQKIEKEELNQTPSVKPDTPLEEQPNEANVKENQSIANQNKSQTIENKSVVLQNKSSVKQNKSSLQENKSMVKENKSLLPPALLDGSNDVSLQLSASRPQAEKVQSSSPSPKLMNSSPPSTEIPTNDKTIDNVYSQSKKEATSKFAQIGVQKALTLQMSIQTDSPVIHRDDTMFIAKQSSIFAQDKQVRSPKSPQQPKDMQDQDIVMSEFQGTVRNNFLSDRKVLNGEKSKREIFRAKIINQIFSSNLKEEMQKFDSVISGRDEINMIKEEGAVTKLASVYPQGIFVGERNLEVELIKTKFTKYLKVLEILAERGDWILTRLFEDSKGLLQDKAFGVWLCKNFQWECYVVDDFLQVDQGNQPLYTLHTGNQKWANVLEKAISSALGGYEQLSRAQTGEIFTLLTGCNSISIKVKEDPSKNNKLLQTINECQRKNYIVHAEKNWDRIKDQQRENIYYVLSVRRSNNDEQALLEISQDGRESFWMRLSKFTQEFNKVQILQLRVNHNFTHIDIGVCKESQMTVIEMNFVESGQGCVTLSYVDHAAPLSAYLYREEKSKVLKLVGQAREKQKSHLFFECNFNEGRYYVFAQTKERVARLCYYGQNTPALKITEQIHNNGLKNEVAEYLPVRETKETKKMQETWNDWKGKTPRLKDNFVESRLRENFVQYILGQTKRKDAQF